MEVNNFILSKNVNFNVLKKNATERKVMIKVYKIQVET